MQSIFHTPEPSLSLCCNSFIEDQDPEWRELDYGADIGPPPETFCQFIKEYDLRMFNDQAASKSKSLQRYTTLMYQYNTAAGQNTYYWFPNKGAPWNKRAPTK